MMQKITAKRRAHKQRHDGDKENQGDVLKYYFKGRQDMAKWRINKGHSRQQVG